MICHNPEAAQRDKHMRAQLVAHLQELLTGSLGALVIMLLASTGFLIALSMLCVALFRTINQVAAMVNVGAMVLGGLGGGAGAAVGHAALGPECGTGQPGILGAGRFPRGESWREAG